MSFKCLLSVLFVTTVSAKAPFLIGSEKCTWGPSYWCQDLKHATECDAIQHCQESVWKGTVKEKGMPCDICKDIIGKIKAFAEDKSKQDKLISYLDGLCEKLPGQAAKECKGAVDKNIPKMFAQLDKCVKDPQKFCQKMGLCGAKSEREVIQALLKHLTPPKKQLSSLLMPGPVILANKNFLKSGPKASSETCVLCEFVMNELVDILKKKSSQQEVEAALKKVCSLMPETIQAECDDFVKRYGPIIIQLIVQEIQPSQICKELKLCKADSHLYKHAVTLLQLRLPASNESCEVCIQVVKEIKAFLRDNATVEEFEELLKMICSYIPVQTIAQQCKALIDTYIPEVIKYIISQDPKAICTEIGECSSADKCYLGASFWCANKRNAKKCKATSFCKKHAWNN